MALAPALRDRGRSRPTQWRRSACRGCSMAGSCWAPTRNRPQFASDNDESRGPGLQPVAQARPVASAGGDLGERRRSPGHRAGGPPRRGRTMESWLGRAASAARLLTTVIAGAIATIVVAAFVGPALRADRSAPYRTTRRTMVRVATLLLTAAAGAGLTGSSLSSSGRARLPDYSSARFGKHPATNAAISRARPCAACLRAAGTRCSRGSAAQSA